MIPPPVCLPEAEIEEGFAFGNSGNGVWDDPTTCLFAGGRDRGEVRIRELRQVVG